VGVRLVLTANRAATVTRAGASSRVQYHRLRVAGMLKIHGAVYPEQHLANGSRDVRDESRVRGLWVCQGREWGRSP